EGAGSAAPLSGNEAGRLLLLAPSSGAGTPRPATGEPKDPIDAESEGAEAEGEPKACPPGTVSRRLLPKRGLPRLRPGIPATGAPGQARGRPPQGLVGAPDTETESRTAAVAERTPLAPQPPAPHAGDGTAPPRARPDENHFGT